MSFADLDTWFGKMFPEPCHPEAQKEKTSGSFLKKQRGSQNRLPLFLDLRSGHLPGPYWQTGGALLGEYTMRSFGEFPNEENASRLSQILQEEAPQKYYLSARACAGILSRAERRGKALPEVLKTALENQMNRYSNAEDTLRM